MPVLKYGLRLLGPGELGWQVVGLKASTLFQAGTDEAWSLPMSHNLSPDASGPLAVATPCICNLVCIRCFHTSMLLYTLLLLSGMFLLHL